MYILSPGKESLLLKFFLNKVLMPWLVHLVVTNLYGMFGQEVGGMEVNLGAWGLDYVCEIWISVSRPETP